MTSRRHLSAAVRRGLEAIGAGMLDHACPDQAAAIEWARHLSETLATAEARQPLRTIHRPRAAAKPERQINNRR